MQETSSTVPPTSLAEEEDPSTSTAAFTFCKVEEVSSMIHQNERSPLELYLSLVPEWLRDCIILPTQSTLTSSNSTENMRCTIDREKARQCYDNCQFADGFQDWVFDFEVFYVFFTLCVNMDLHRNLRPLFRWPSLRFPFCFHMLASGDTMVRCMKDYDILGTYNDTGCGSGGSTLSFPSPFSMTQHNMPDLKYKYAAIYALYDPIFQQERENYPNYYRICSNPDCKNERQEMTVLTFLKVNLARSIAADEPSLIRFIFSKEYEIRDSCILGQKKKSSVEDLLRCASWETALNFGTHYSPRGPRKGADYPILITIFKFIEKFIQPHSKMDIAEAHVQSLIAACLLGHEESPITKKIIDYSYGLAAKILYSAKPTPLVTPNTISFRNSWIHYHFHRCLPQEAILPIPSANHLMQLPLGAKLADLPTCPPAPAPDPSQSATRSRAPNGLQGANADPRRFPSAPNPTSASTSLALPLPNGMED